MSLVICQELITELEQQINFSGETKRIISGVKIGLVMYNSPSGTFNLALKDLSNNTIASKDFTSDDIKTGLNTSDNYAYLNLPLEFDNILCVKNGSYKFVLSASGYTFSDSSFLGWIKPFQDIYNAREDDFESVESNPHFIMPFERVREDLIPWARDF